MLHSIVLTANTARTCTLHTSQVALSVPLGLLIEGREGDNSLHSDGVGVFWVSEIARLVKVLLPHLETLVQSECTW